MQQVFGIKYWTYHLSVPFQFFCKTNNASGPWSRAQKRLEQSESPKQKTSISQSLQNGISLQLSKHFFLSNHRTWFSSSYLKRATIKKTVQKCPFCMLEVGLNEFRFYGSDEVTPWVVCRLVCFRSQFWSTLWGNYCGRLLILLTLKGFWGL